MKPFNLECALAGDPVVTCSGSEVTALIKHVTCTTGARWTTLAGICRGQIYFWDTLGKYDGDGTSGDLMMASTSKTGWLAITGMQDTVPQVYDGRIFNSKQDAENYGIAVKIEWEE